MNISTVLKNFAYIALGLVAAATLGFAQTATPPGANVDAPLHTGPDQVKNGSLSVNTFLANQNAAFKQQTFLNGVVFGGKPGDATSTVNIGDTAAPANISVNGNLSAVSFLQSSSVANASSYHLCATANGTIVTCGTQAPAGAPPSITQIGPSNYVNNVDQQIFQIGPSVAAGYVYRMGVYSYNVTVTAVAGDSPESIVQKLVTAINSTTATQWRSASPGGVGVPANGTPGFPPSAQSSTLNATYIITTVDNVHQFGASASSS